MKVIGEGLRRARKSDGADNWITASFAGHAAAKSCQSCLTLCDPIDGSPPGSGPWDSPGKNTGVGLPFPSPMNESEK